ncbi:MAG: RNA-binding S4 domain-containing protein [Leptolyngbyaceae cyanobacterium]
MGINKTTGEPFIKLDQFLKWQRVVQTGGEAKLLIRDGNVEVNGEMELRRGRKLYAGDEVAVGDFVYTVQGSDNAE